MLTITPDALKRLEQRLARAGADNTTALRLSQTDGRWRISVDRAQPDDATFSHEGRNVLLLDHAAELLVDRMTLDVRTTEAGVRLKLRRSGRSKR